MAAREQAAARQSGEDLSEERFGDSDLCELECDVAAMSHDLDADFDELLPECRQRPVLDLLRQRQRAQEVAYIVGQGVKLEAKVESRICSRLATDFGCRSCG